MKGSHELLLQGSTTKVAEYLEVGFSDAHILNSQEGKQEKFKQSVFS